MYWALWLALRRQRSHRRTQDMGLRLGLGLVRAECEAKCPQHPKNRTEAERNVEMLGFF